MSEEPTSLEGEERLGTDRRSIIRLVALLAAILVIGGVGTIYLQLRSFGKMFSGTRPAPEAATMSEADRLAETKRRAESIRAAMLKYYEAHGTLPQKLEELVPEFLPQIPTSLMSTMPFRLSWHEGRFAVVFESWPNAMYESEWVEQDGTWGGDH